MGWSVGYDLTNRTVLIGKYFESDNVKSGLESDPTLPDLDLGKPASRTVIGSVAYRTGALRFSGGYRFASTGSISAHAITEGARAQQATSVPAQYPAA